jgi:DNA polymerase-1
MGLPQPMTRTKTLLLVDGSSYLHRAFNALPSLSASTGEPTGALYGVINMLRKLLQDFQAEYLAVVFDAPGKTFRHELFAAYKAHRPPMPEELARQIEPLQAIIRAMGLPVLQIPGVEADDVIATLARRAAAEGMRVVIATSDKDMNQLVDENITLLDTMKGTATDPETVQQKFGVAPALIADYLALTGDNSDNIPGVPGVGPKTAARWLQIYGSLEAVIANALAIPGKAGESLRANLEQLLLARELATLDCNVALHLAPEQLRSTPPDNAALRELYSHYEFRGWLKQLAGPETATSAPPEGIPCYQIVLKASELDEWLERLRQATLFAFDTETTSLDYLGARIVGVSLAIQPFEAAYVPLNHDYPGAPEQLQREAVLDELRPLLEDHRRAKLGQNLKYDYHVLANHGIQLAGLQHDTMLESYVLNSTATRHDMDSLAKQYLGIKTTRYEEVTGKGTKQIGFDQVPLEQAGPYAAKDADITLRLHCHLWPKLEREASLRGLYEDIEIPLIPVLARMERCGVQLDTELLHRQSAEFAKRLLELEREAYSLVGEPFNLNSTKDLQHILFEREGLPVRKRTPKGQPSTAEDILQDLALDYPLPSLILKYRSLSKLKSTYTDRLPQQVEPTTGRVHTSYHQAVASTGRLSSSDPNLQNIPTRAPEGRNIRRAFIAPPGYHILAADYSQIELRILAHFSGDERLLEAFSRGEDIHQATAAEVFSVPLASVSPAQRRAAKTINFGLIYGMSAFGLARQLGIERAAAQAYVDRYFARYPGVQTFMEDIRRQAAAKGYVETLFGRRLYLPEIRSPNPQRRQAAERTAINAPMQGTAADIIKLAMLALDRWLNESKLRARMIMQVHDELVFEVAEEEEDEAQVKIRQHMMTAAALRVPLEVDVGVGMNWDEAH